MSSESVMNATVEESAETQVIGPRPNVMESGHRVSHVQHSRWNDQTLLSTQRLLDRARTERMELLTKIYEGVNPIELGYSHRSDFAWSVLGLSNRSWQAQARIWKAIRSLPLTREAYADGLLSDAKLMILLSRLTSDNEASWLRRAVRLGPDKLRRLIDQDSETSDHGQTAGYSQTSGNSPTSDHSQPRPDPDPDPDPDASPGLQIRCPFRTYWTCEAFAHEVSRRIGHQASMQDWVDVAAASFLAGTTPSQKGDIVRRVHWPPLFLKDATVQGSHHSPEPRNKLLALDAYVYRADGNPVETNGPWLRFWRKEAARRGVPEPQPGEEGWAFFQGIPAHQTDGFSFVTGERRSSGSTEPEPTGSVFGRENALQALLRDRLENVIGSASVASSASATRAGTGAGAGAGTASPDTALPSLIRKFRETEAKIRVLSRLRLRCLRQIRLDRSYYAAGFKTFCDFVEHRVRASGRTANRWLRKPEISRTLELAEADPQLSTQAVRQLTRLESAGADERALQKWVQKALLVPLKEFRNQVDWTLAQEDLTLAEFPLDKLVPVGDSANENTRFEPPAAGAWTAISGLLKKDPHLIGCSDFHQATQDIRSENTPHELDEPPSEAADSTGTSRTISARLTEAASPPVTIPDPAEPTPRCLHLYLTVEAIDNLARAFAILRARYGEDKPDWWCLEVLLLQVLAGWSDEDADFRRRTREFSTLARDGFQCQNPFCTARRNLTVHHIVFRSAQGSDAADNKVTLCAACHLQGVHQVGSIRVAGTAPDELTWHVGQGQWKVIVRHGEIVKKGRNWDPS